MRTTPKVQSLVPAADSPPGLLMGTFVAATLGLPVWAGPTTTADVGNSADYLAHHATCGDVMEAWNAIPNTTTEQDLLILNSVSFQFGYASTKGITPEAAWDEILARCYEDLDQPFAGFPE